MVILYHLPNKNKSFLVISLLIWLCFISLACLYVFGAVVTVVSTALHSLTLVCQHLLHATLFPWGEIREIKVNKKFWNYFLLCSFSCWFDLIFDLCYACKLWLWCCKGCVPVQSVKMGVAATHRTVLEITGTCAPAQAIPTA